MIAAGPRRTRAARWLGAAVAALLVTGQEAAAQAEAAIDVRGEVFVGSELERYLRDLQVAGIAMPYPWSIRGFSPAETNRALTAAADHPWEGRYTAAEDTARRLRLRAVRPRAQVFFNSAFPYGSRDGPVWAGRGLTTSLEGGVAGEWGPVSLTLAPMLVVAQNSAFPLMDSGVDGMPPAADPFHPDWIDLPQRFGEGRHVAVDPGQSTLRLDARGVAAGVSSANLHWGPASDHPILLGNEAAGFPHFFFGTARPLNLWIGSLHGRMVWGELRESPWIVEPLGRRLFAGTVATFSPRGVPGLEVGGARAFHAAWPTDGWAGAILRPLEGLLKSSRAGGPDDDGSDPQNQLASLFFRWSHPRAGVEVWGEFGRDDHSFDLRDFLLEPDHYSALLLGGRKVWGAQGGTLTSLRAEFVNARVTHLARVRPQGPFYVHSTMRQGHTHRGQLLGSPAAYAGLGSVVALDHYRRDGRWSVAWWRTLQDATGAQQALAQTADGAWASNSLAVERLLFVRRLEVGGRLVATHQFNRYFQDDAFNLNLALQVSHAF